MNMKIPQNIIDRIRTHTDIVELISGYVPLKQAGVNFKGLCPFHKEKTPSFVVSPPKEIFHCFGCGKGGNVFSFLQEIENISFIEAVRQLAAKTNTSLSEYENKESDPQQRKINDFIFEINSHALDYFIKMLNSSIGYSAQTYLSKRNLSLQTIRKYQLGFAPSTKTGLLQYLAAKKYTNNFLKTSGLFGISDNSSMFDKFRNRIIFPIHNLSGLITGFGGRALDEHQQPKYLNSPDTPVYKKSEVLYGLNFSKSEIRKQKNCVLVEGYMDYLSLVDNGFQNVVAACGTSLTESQSYLIKRFSNRVTMLYDGDNAGQKAAWRSLPILLSKGLEVKITCLPKDDDPDTFLKKHEKSELDKAIKNSKNFVDFIADMISTNDSVRTPEKKSLVVDNLLKVIKEIPNVIIQSEYLKLVSRRLNIAENIIEKRFNGINRDIQKEPGRIENTDKKSRQYLFEENIISFIIKFPKQCLALSKGLNAGTFKDASFKIIFDCYLRQGIQKTQEFMDYLEPAEQSIITRIIFVYDDHDFDADAWFKIVANYRKHLIKAEMKQLKGQIQNGAKNKSALIEIFKKLSLNLKELENEKPT
ncbi:MAG: DNA primase [bacterium]